MEELGWNQLGIVGTIYEEEDEDEDSSSSTTTIPSLDSTPSPTPPLSGVEPWGLARRHDPDVVIHVQDSCFRLHKGALIAKSTYLKRQLSEFSEITLSPPLNITAQTFSLVTDFCHGNHVAITPFNVAALRTAAELLGMAETSGGAGDENLLQKTEAYFRQAISVNKEYAAIVLRSCFQLLPLAETAASLISRCVEALSMTAETDGDVSCLDGFKSVRFEDLKLVLEAVSQRLTDCHDLLYRIIDIYLKENIGTVSEDQKIQMCNYMDCSVLSPKLLMHAVQNPTMPLRFVVQAMFLQQLNTRHSIISAASASADHHHHRRRSHHHHPDKTAADTTLGALLQRDAALRQVSQLKAIMTATNSRIETLEKELTGMRKLLSEPGSGRSASFRFSNESSNKIERGQLGSVSASGFGKKFIRTEASFSSEESSDWSSSSNVDHQKNFGRRLVSGLKSVFGLQKKKCENKEAIIKNGGKLEEDHIGNEKIVIIKKDQAFQRRTRSQS